MSLTPELLEQLGTFDTPTICNALELVAPERHGYGFTTVPFFNPRPELPAIVGYARTAKIRATKPEVFDPAEATAMRLAYYDYVASGSGPTITVIEDVDTPAGFGAFWGEVNTNIHQGLGSLGVITNGSIRDIPDSAEGFALMAGKIGPTHAWVRVEAHGVPVSVHGMDVEPDDLIHADQHGAVIIPIEVAEQIPDAVADIVAKESVLINASRQPGFNAAVLRSLMTDGPGH